MLGSHPIVSKGYITQYTYGAKGNDKLFGLELTYINPLDDTGVTDRLVVWDDLSPAAKHSLNVGDFGGHPFPLNDDNFQKTVEMMRTPGIY